METMIDRGEPPEAPVDKGGRVLNPPPQPMETMIDRGKPPKAPVKKGGGSQTRPRNPWKP